MLLVTEPFPFFAFNSFNFLDMAYFVCAPIFMTGQNHFSLIISALTILLNVTFILMTRKTGRGYSMYLVILKQFQHIYMHWFNPNWHGVDGIIILHWKIPVSPQPKIRLTWDQFVKLQPYRVVLNIMHVNLGVKMSWTSFPPHLDMVQTPISDILLKMSKINPI